MPLPEEERQDRIKILTREMQDHPGELVLMVVRHWEPYGFDMPEDETPYGLDTDYYLGVVQESYLEVGDANFSPIKITTNQHVTFDERRPHLGIKRGDGPMTNFRAWAINLDRKAELGVDNDLESGADRKLLEIVVSDRAVGEWIERQATEGRMSRWTLRQRERDPQLFEAEKRKNLDVDLLVSFQRMHRMLGKELVFSEEAAGLVEEGLSKKRVEILERLLRLTSDNLVLTRRRAEIKGLKLPRVGFPLEDASYERQVRNDERDLRILKSIPLAEEQRKLQGQIRRELTEILRLGMHEDPWVIIDEPRPGEKTEIDVPRLIRGLCEYYEVPIPRN